MPAKKAKPTVRKKAGRPAPAPAPARKAKTAKPTKRLLVQDLQRIRDEARALATTRTGEGRAVVTVHMGTCGIAAGARDIMNALLDEMKKKKVTDVIVTTSGCAGFCNREPMATVALQSQPPVKYADLTAEKIRRILNDHVLGGKPVVPLALAVGHETLY